MSTFLFNTDWRDVLVGYAAEVRLEVYEAVIEYAASGTLPRLKPLAQMAFSFIKLQIDSSVKESDVTTQQSTNSSPPRQQRFRIPSVEEVRQYFAEKKLNASPDSFHDYYTANGWRCGRNPMKDWQAAARSWNRRQHEFEKTPAAAQRQQHLDLTTDYTFNGGFGGKDI